ncbi:NTP transferase domain-containing protein [Candidatus Saccharibacteria bacterium]|nr:MAG: NTP transferase domain-containing protein [Candidatus Saccharibacteria bacterium]
MITVIIAGGSGTRLWPLSTPDFPKQLLKLTNDKSMVKNTYDRASQISTEIYVVPDISHAHHIKAQMPQVDEEHFITEPGRRGTANCIVAALAYISKRHDNDEPIAFLHADHHIRDVEGFVASFNLAQQVTNAQKRITLIGIEPTFPATGFGYIERDGKLAGTTQAYRVESFKEKPDFKTAKKYVASGRYYWNCGYFVGSVNTFVSEMKAHAPSLYQNYQKLITAGDDDSKNYADTYLSFENEVIDIALIEKLEELYVVPAGFDWMDLGSFKDLHEANESDEHGNHCRGGNIYEDEVENTYIRNEEDKPVVVIGLDNIVVVNTPNGILVARKDLSQKVKDAVERMKEQ